LNSALASFLPQRNQKQYDADRRQNNSDSKARGGDFGAEMIIFFESPSEAYQERKNANAEQNQPDRSLVIVGDFHWLRPIKYSRQPKIQVRSLAGGR
jgi:hypothetical protein